MERVFRVRKWSKLVGTIRWRPNKKYLFDDLADYKQAWKTYSKFVDRTEGRRVIARITGDEFINGAWILVDVYPSEEKE